MLSIFQGMLPSVQVVLAYFQGVLSGIQVMLACFQGDKPIVDRLQFFPKDGPKHIHQFFIVRHRASPFQPIKFLKNILLVSPGKTIH
jgi:hypothetical protein